MKLENDNCIHVRSPHTCTNRNNILHIARYPVVCIHDNQAARKAKKKKNIWWKRKNLWCGKYDFQGALSHLDRNRINTVLRTRTPSVNCAAGHVRRNQRSFGWKAAFKRIPSLSSKIRQGVAVCRHLFFFSSFWLSYSCLLSNPRDKYGDMKQLVTLHCLCDESKSGVSQLEGDRKSLIQDLWQGEKSGSRQHLCLSVSN